MVSCKRCCHVWTCTIRSRESLPGIISPLAGQTEHHITSTHVFVEKIQDLKLEPDRSIVSFDVSALFTSIPVKEALDVVQEFLEHLDSWRSGEAENLETEDVIQLKSFCLSTTYFVFLWEIVSTKRWMCYG